MLSVASGHTVLHSDGEIRKDAGRSGMMMLHKMISVVASQTNSPKIVMAVPDNTSTWSSNATFLEIEKIPVFPDCSSSENNIGSFTTSDGLGYKK